MSDKKPKESPLTLKDVINYDPELYLQPDEVSWIQNTFKNNPMGIRVLRKVLLPTIADPTMPIEQFPNDFLGAGYDFAQIPHEALKTIVLARQDAIKFIAGGLIKLKVIANNKPESEQDRNARLAKDSLK